MKRTFLDDTNEYRYTGGRFVWIYFIVCQQSRYSEWKNRVKIGIARNVEKRCAALQTGSPFPLAIWHAFKVQEDMARTYEKKLHRKFKWCRDHGEWFKIYPCVRKWIKAHKQMLKKGDPSAPLVWDKSKTYNDMVTVEQTRSNNIKKKTHTKRVRLCETEWQTEKMRWPGLKVIA